MELLSSQYFTLSESLSLLSNSVNSVSIEDERDKDLFKTKAAGLVSRNVSTVILPPYSSVFSIKIARQIISDYR